MLVGLYKEKKMKIVNSLFEDILQRKYPWYVRLGWRIGWKRDAIVWFCKRWWHRWKDGFAHEESWTFNSFHSDWVTPRLKYLRANLHAHPGRINMEEWESILDKMIWSFENWDDPPKPIYSDDYDHRYEVTETETGTMYTPLNKTGTIDYTPVEEHTERVDEGLKLFAEYYRDLWD